MTGRRSPCGATAVGGVIALDLAARAGTGRQARPRGSPRPAPVAARGLSVRGTVYEGQELADG